MSSSLVSHHSEIKESGEAIQEAQNTTVATGAAATVILVRELLKNLKLPKKPVNVAIKINDSVVYEGNISSDLLTSKVEAETPSLSEDVLNYLKEVVKLPVSTQPASLDNFPLNQDVTITVNNKEVFSLKNGIVEKNLLNGQVDLSQENTVKTNQHPTTAPSQDNPVQQSQRKIPLPVPSIDNLQPSVSSSQEKSTPLSEVEVVEEPEIPNLKPVNVSLSNEQKQALEEAGVNSQTIEKVEEAINQNSSNSTPLVVVNHSLDNNDSIQNPNSNSTETRKGFFESLRNFVGITSPEEEYELEEAEPVEKEIEIVEEVGGDSEVTEKVEKVVNQNQSSSVPFIIVVNQAVNNSKSQGHTQNNFKGLVSKIQNAVKDITRKIGSILSSTRERFFPTTDKNLKQDLQTIAAINVANRLIDNYGSRPNSQGKQVFEGNSFRVERTTNNDLTLTAKDGRGVILSQKDGVLSNSLTQRDVEKFKAVANFLNQEQSKTKQKQSQAEIG